MFAFFSLCRFLFTDLRECRSGIESTAFVYPGGQISSFFSVDLWDEAQGLWRNCGVNLSGNPDSWLPSEEDNSKDKAMDHLTVTKRNEPYHVWRTQYLYKEKWWEKYLVCINNQSGLSCKLVASQKTCPFVICVLLISANGKLQFTKEVCSFAPVCNKPQYNPLGRSQGRPTYKLWMAQVGWLFSGWTVSIWRHGNWTRGVRFLIRENPIAPFYHWIPETRNLRRFLNPKP